MQRIVLHIESNSWFNPGKDYTVCGACTAES